MAAEEDHVRNRWKVSAAREKRIGRKSSLARDCLGACKMETNTIYRAEKAGGEDEEVQRSPPPTKKTARGMDQRVAANNGRKMQGEREQGEETGFFTVLDNNTKRRLSEGGNRQ